MDSFKGRETSSYYLVKILHCNLQGMEVSTRWEMSVLPPPLRYSPGDGESRLSHSSNYQLLIQYDPRGSNLTFYY